VDFVVAVLEQSWQLSTSTRVPNSILQQQTANRRISHHHRLGMQRAKAGVISFIEELVKVSFDISLRISAYRVEQAIFVKELIPLQNRSTVFIVHDPCLLLPMVASLPYIGDVVADFSTTYMRYYRV